MRPFVQEQLADRTLPLIMAHKGGTAYGRENALSTIQKGLAHKPDIIEVDVRKSRDGILYCHHGSVPFGTIAAGFFGLLTFAQIQKLIGHRNTLAEILNAIPEDMLVYLDLKDSWITANDLKPIIKNRKGVWIAPFGSLKWLKKLRAELGEEYAYAFNCPVLFPRRAARRLAGNADVFQFAWWSWTGKKVAAIEENGIACHLLEWFISREKYLERMPLSRYRGLFFSIYDLADAADVRP